MTYIPKFDKEKCPHGDLEVCKNRPLEFEEELHNHMLVDCLVAKDGRHFWQPYRFVNSRREMICAYCTDKLLID